MLSLREYRNKADRLADFLPWAALVAPGVVLNKDGSVQRTARSRHSESNDSRIGAAGVCGSGISLGYRRGFAAAHERGASWFG